MKSSPRRQRRSAILRQLGASDAAHDALLAYNDAPHLDAATLPDPLDLPLEAEPLVDAWSDYVARAAEVGAAQALREALVQLHFPIREGIAKDPRYRAVTLKGDAPHVHAELATGLALEREHELELTLHQSAAGPIPIIACRHRRDFVALARALAHRNEPVEIPPSQGALMIAGLNNWDRIRRYRRGWQARAIDSSDAAWKLEFRRLVKQKALFQDRLILLDDQPYSGVPAAELGLEDAAWREMSLVIRREHECVHYLTTRVFGGMANNALDELCADFVGIAAALGEYRADWFLRFIGLERHPDAFRPGGRLEIYRADLDDEAFGLLQTLVARAAHAVETRCRDEAIDLADAAERTRVVLALASSRLELISEGEY
ncbi:MAG: hypothetical protein KC503_36610 [Myxococcales bacterium]|nr:hypothetical protein [Myxococcales bacterium]